LGGGRDRKAYLDGFLKYKVEFCYVTGSEGLSGEQNCDERGLPASKCSLQKLKLPGLNL